MMGPGGRGDLLLFQAAGPIIIMRMIMMATREAFKGLCPASL